MISPVSTRLLVGLVVLALGPQASVVGVVRSYDGQPVAGAEVILSDLGRTVVTDAGGAYAFHDVPAGPQHLSVSRIGYAGRTIDALVPVGGELRIDFTLRVEPVNLPEVTVSSGGSRRAPKSDGPSWPMERTVTRPMMQTSPLLAEPDALRALAGGSVVVEPESGKGVHIRGGRADQTQYVVDGIPVFSPYHAAGLFSGWNPDALDQAGVTSAFPDPTQPAALSGTVSARTRSPGDRFGIQGSTSTSQARVTASGPLGAQGGFLLGLRTGFPDLFAPGGESEYLRGELGDHIAKLERPVFGGLLSALSVGGENELSTASPQGPNRFEWTGHSMGLAWTRTLGARRVTARVWRAQGDAASTWQTTSVQGLRSGRTDLGATVSAGGLLGNRVLLGMRMEHIQTEYRTGDPDTNEAPVSQRASVPLATVFGRFDHQLLPTLHLASGTSFSAGAGGLRWGPQALFRWTPAPGLAFTGSYARTHQFAQSLHNSESLARYVFPADLYVAAGDGVPTARADLGVAGVDWNLGAGIRLGAHAFAKRMHGILLVAPVEPGPFSSGAFETGGGRARGLSAEASLTTGRVAFRTLYGLQQVEAWSRATGTIYTPGYATAHLLDAGATFFPSATWLVRMSASHAAGRRTTPTAGTFEWESCNLFDRGCEFTGSPTLAGAPGGRLLPGYLRVDIGARKHWHVDIRGRDAYVAVFGTLTNVLGRPNVLTQVLDPETAQFRRIDMRPFSPLVVGLDWRF